MHICNLVCRHQDSLLLLTTPAAAAAPSCNTHTLLANNSKKKYPNNRAGTGWYHDHGIHVSKGVAAWVYEKR
jgi:hypothetical protein